MLPAYEAGSEDLEFTGPAFLKGHGTENDFVLLPDRDGRIELTAERVRAICDRRAGIGADGVIRVAPGRNTGTGAEFFMDYWNADGSLAEMCGNGSRVFARFLVAAGWAAPGTLTFDTRAGLRTAWLGEQGPVRVDMGPVTLGGASTAAVAGRRFEGTAVDVGNPHLACLTDVPLAELDLSTAPDFDATVFPSGVNVEFVHRPAGPVAEIAMRVHERGSGETRSCGTGTVAAAAVALAADGRRAGTLGVRVPGGRVVVTVADDGTATLEGPAVLVAVGRLDATLWPDAG
ncbi:diaminopimelate epimerase [Nakamurella leprariae]|uniref:diaminopimelate epimerase n=1 Tax=Nakamurella leprariae TaxID=2803911 RepID=UPI0038B40B18